MEKPEMSTQRDNWPEKYFILKDTRLIDFPRVQKIIFINDDIQTINEANQLAVEKIRQIHFTGEPQQALNITTRTAQLIKIFPRSKNELIKYVKPLKEKGAVISPAYAVHNLEDISMVTSMGLVVDLIDIIDNLDLKLILNLLDYYLHNASLDVPIEPFHTILVSKLSHTNQTLWNMNMINPDQFFYCDETGLSESPESLNNRQYRYKIDYQSKTFLPTDQRSSLLSYFESLPGSRPACLACHHFHICIAWALYEKNSCHLWKKCLNILQEASRELTELEKFDLEHQIANPDQH